MIQGMDVKRRGDGGYTVCLHCVGCSQTVCPLDYLAFIPPGRVGMKSGLLCHKKCCDGRILQLMGSSHIAILRVDELARQLAYVLDNAGQPMALNT